MGTVCPGQDTRFWKPTDIFDVSCASCGVPVEFFRDDVSRRCHGCGALIRNPKITLGCAQWCEHAKACLGYDPKEEAAHADAAEASLLDRLIEGLKNQKASSPEMVDHSIALIEEVEELLRSETVDRRIVLAGAAIQSFDDREEARKFLTDAGAEARTVAEALSLIAAEGPGSSERDLLNDAELLTELRVARKTIEPSTLTTQAARQRAAKLIASLEARD